MPVIKANRVGVAWNWYVTNKSLPMSSSVVGYGQGISLGGPTSQVGDDSYGIRHMQQAVTRSFVEGSPNTPSLCLQHVGMWRFRWVVKPGQRQVVVRTKQVKSYTGQRPTMTVKANTNVGLNSDLVATAPASSDWTLIGPIIFTSTGTDALWVELRNNLLMDDAAAFFDHIIIT